ncbi:MAG: DEAD/DEAH box helicase [Nitrososphaeraceae archaeon]
MDIFSTCHIINNYISQDNEKAARNELIKLLEIIKKDGLEYSPLVNHLIREVGLYPYMEPSTSLWQDRFVFEAFKSDVGEDKPVTLHREQSRLLSTLLSGKSVAVSAPTSFGKSFIIDSFISIKKPKNVVILVPTIALADETRRRLNRKFGSDYKIITTPDQALGKKNILIFPQERAISYTSSLNEIDILIVDEFYKASKSFDRERSPALIRAIILFGKIAKQKYFLAPNISKMRESPFTKGMEVLHLDINTVFLEKNELYIEIGNDELKKSEALLGILKSNSGKTLIYAGTYSNIKKLANLLMSSLESRDRILLHQFHSWLAVNYDPNWELTKLVPKGVGIHNGQLHRSLSQIQIRLFEEDYGIDQIISTSSIIEGVNTSAENIIVWSNKNGTAKINDFTYKNIIGRGGRMFRHFVGKIFILEPPPTEESIQLELEFPDSLLGTIDDDYFEFEYTPDQVAIIQEYENEMRKILGGDNIDYFRNNDTFQISDRKLIIDIVKDIKLNPSSWNGLGYLNSWDVNNWDRLLYKLMKLQPSAWEIQWAKYVEFVKTLSSNWSKTIPEMLDDLSKVDISIEEFFKLERITTFKLASLLGDVHTIYNKINYKTPIDLSLAISRFAHAFLPPVVFQLEEYGIPTAGVIDLENVEYDIYDVINMFHNIGYEHLVKSVGDFVDFDLYILRYFYEGITHQKEN